MFKISREKNIGPVVSISIKNVKLKLCFCHKLENRTINIFGLGKYLCARCQGIFIGFIVGFLLLSLGLRLSLILSISCFIPLLIDGFTQLFGYRESINSLRFTTGLLASVGLICYDLNIRSWNL